MLKIYVLSTNLMHEDLIFIVSQLGLFQVSIND